MSAFASVYSCVLVMTSAALQTIGERITGTDSLLHDTDKKLDPDLLSVVDTRCQMLKLKCTKFDSEWGSNPDPTGEACSAPQTL